MEHIKISTAQFENRSGDKEYNLSVMDRLSEEAACKGSQVIAFHECSVTGYTFARNLNSKQLLDLAEYIPEGDSVKKLAMIAGKYNITLLAGLFEKDNSNRVYKACVCVDRNGLIARHRKLHPFIHPDILPGNDYTVFELNGWKCGI
ncbi:MAG: hypothetical protein JW705_06050, partial [Methanosarcinaceae archaeon]|nr:hypothetical protein [Methanosarcinaceae archaeon]